MRRFSKASKILIVLFLVIVSVTVYICTVGIKFVADMCAEEIRSEITDIVNKSNESIQKMDVMYEDYFKVSQDEDGKIRLLSANTGLINQINMIVQTEIQNRLDLLRDKDFYIGVGAFTGSAVLSEFGTQIPIHSKVVANCSTELVSEFSKIGINNTLHRLQINCIISVKILIPSKSIVQDVHNELLIAESILQGEVPTTYLGENTPTDYVDLLPD